MEFFNLSGVTSQPAQKLAVEIIQAMVRNLSADLRQRLAGGEVLSAKVIESSPKSAQIEVAGRLYNVKFPPEARVSNLPGVITLRHHAPKAELAGQPTTGQNRDTPVQIRLDSRPVSSPQSPSVPTVQSPQTASTFPLSTVNGLLVRAEMLKPIVQNTSAPASQAAATATSSAQAAPSTPQATIQATALPSTTTTPAPAPTITPVATSTSTVASQPVQATSTAPVSQVQNASPVPASLVATQTAVSSATQPSKPATETSLQPTPIANVSAKTTATVSVAPSRTVAQAPAQTVQNSLQSPLNTNSTQTALPQTTTAISGHNPTGTAQPTVQSTLQVAAQPTAQPATQPVAVSSVIGHTPAATVRQRTAASATQAVQNQSATQPATKPVPNTASPTKPDVFQTPNLRASVPNASATQSSVAARPNQAAASAIVSAVPKVTVPATAASGQAPQLATAIQQPTVTQVTQGTQISQTAQPQSSPAVVSTAKPMPVSPPPSVSGEAPAAARSHNTAPQTAQQFTQKASISSENPAPLRQQPASVRSEAGVLARFTQSYQQVQQQASTQSTPQVTQLAQWTKSGQTVQLQVYDPRLAPRNTPQIQGTAIATDQTGRTILTTPKGQVAVALPRPIPVGTEVMLAEPASVHSASGRLRFGAMESLLVGASSPAMQAVKAGLPQPNAQMSHAMLFFLVALRQNSGLQSWWGNRIQQAMRLNPDSLNAAEEEFQQAQPAVVQADTAWQSYSLPLQVGDEIVKLLFYWRGSKESSDDADNSDKNIFAVEGYHHDIGRFRLDGQFLRRQLNIQWASDRALEAKSEQGLIALYHQYSELYKITGQIQFQLLGDRRLWMDTDADTEQLQV